ncbi:MAG: HIT family protein [Sphingobacteriaceae bacterium]|jgi:histidine triad (HIT) family protein
MSSIFSKIIAGEIPAYKVAETDQFIAFLDILPLAKGHVLCIPKKEIDYIFEMEDADYLALMHFSKKVAKGIKQVIPCQKVGVAVIGLEVPHAHVHLIPMNTVQDMNFSNPRLTFTKEEYLQLVETISAAISI